MFTIDNEYTFQYIIKKSKFIVKLIDINDNDNINILLDKIKKEYPKATHYCYAYVLKNYSKYSDDKEPTGTAGIPILNSVNNKNLCNVLCVVIRYFGGIKLGASGLIRTYGKVVRDSIDLCDLKPIIDYVIFNIKFDYDKLSYVDNILNDYIIDKYFNEKVEYKIKLPSNIYDEIINKLQANNIHIFDNGIGL